MFGPQRLITVFVFGVQIKMKIISLTQNRTALIDDEDYSFISKFKWCVSSNRGQPSYAMTRLPNSGKPGKRMYMHQMLMNAPSPLCVDHINGNKFDNRKANLRICTRSENLRNGKKKKHGLTSKYKGVWKSDGRWHAQIYQQPNKAKSLGTFKTELEAAVAYNEAAIKYYGEYAKINLLHKEQCASCGRKRHPSNMKDGECGYCAYGETPEGNDYDLEEWDFEETDRE